MDVNPRKIPLQGRSKATVEAIVEASAQVLLEAGFERFTTARVAERAGVSVGSLYQYFPNKAALVCAVIDKCCENFLGAFQGALSARPRTSLGECVDAIVEATIVSHHLTPELHRIVLDLAPRIGVSDKADRVGLETARTIERQLRVHEAEIAGDIDLAVAAAMIETILETLAHRAVRGQSPLIDQHGLAREARRMVLRYLTA